MLNKSIYLKYVEKHMDEMLLTVCEKPNPLYPSGFIKGEKILLKGLILTELHKLHTSDPHIYHVLVLGIMQLYLINNCNKQTMRKVTNRENVDTIILSLTDITTQLGRAVYNGLLAAQREIEI